MLEATNRFKKIQCKKHKHIYNERNLQVMTQGNIMIQLNNSQVSTWGLVVHTTQRGKCCDIIVY